MIGNTVDTDLIGEVVEVYHLRAIYEQTGTRTTTIKGYERDLMARGRVRAVTTGEKGMMLWLHIFDEECVKSVTEWPKGSVIRTNDIVAVTTAFKDGSAILHLIRETPP